MSSLPRVSCICVTYNRPPDRQWLLEEAVESFRRQRYPDCELIVLNTAPSRSSSVACRECGC